MVEKFTKNLIPSAIIVAGLVIAGAFIYVNQGKIGEKVSGLLFPQQASELAINYINQNLLEEGTTASLANVIEKSGVYKIHLKIGEDEYDSYVTKDGKILFTEGYDLEKVAQKENVETQPESQEKKEEYSEEKLEALAKCLTERGAKFYGASWCGYCKKQKELFSKAVQYLPYVECSEKETQELAPQCEAAGIVSFPTWEFNGEKNPGLKTLEELAELSGCQL